MENASKALLMAASVLIGIVIISAFILMMSTLTDYQSQTNQATANEQTVEFNNQYLAYANDGTRGYDMVSLMNKIIDYNSRKSIEGYTEMGITIKLTADNLNDFKYDTTSSNKLITDPEYTQATIGNIVNPAKQIEDTYGTEYARQFASEISNIQDIIKDTSLSNSQKIERFNDARYWNQTVGDITQLNRIYADAQMYYEFVNFKRAYFDCDESKIQYDQHTGRIIHMEFSCTGMG